MPAKRPPLPGTLASLAECGRHVFIVCEDCGRFTVTKFHRTAQDVGWASMVTEHLQTPVLQALQAPRCALSLDRSRGRMR